MWNGATSAWIARVTLAGHNRATATLRTRPAAVRTLLLNDTRCDPNRGCRATVAALVSHE